MKYEQSETERKTWTEHENERLRMKNYLIISNAGRGFGGGRVLTIKITICKLTFRAGTIFLCGLSVYINCSKSIFIC